MPGGVRIIEVVLYSYYYIGILYSRACSLIQWAHSNFSMFHVDLDKARFSEGENWQFINYQWNDKFWLDWNARSVHSLAVCSTPNNYKGILWNAKSVSRFLLTFLWGFNFIKELKKWGYGYALRYHHSTKLTTPQSVSVVDTPVLFQPLPRSVVVASLPAVRIYPASVDVVVNILHMLWGNHQHEVKLAASMLEGLWKHGDKLFVPV